MIEAVPEIHHLGDDRFEGRMNSAFRKTAEGSVFMAEFGLDRNQLPPNLNSPEVAILVKGVQLRHAVLINGMLPDARLSHSPSDGSFG